MWLEEDISKVVSFFDCPRKNRAGAKTDYVFNFLLHLPNFFGAQKYGTDSRCGRKNICALCGGCVARHILRVKQGKGRLTCAKAEWTGGCYTGGHLLADSRHRQWKWRLPQIHTYNINGNTNTIETYIQYKWKYKYNRNRHTNTIQLEIQMEGTNACQCKYI